MPNPQPGRGLWQLPPHLPLHALCPHCPKQLHWSGPSASVGWDGTQTALCQDLEQAAPPQAVLIWGPHSWTNEVQKNSR